MNDNELDNLMVLTYCKEQGQFQIETALNERIASIRKHQKIEACPNYLFLCVFENSKLPSIYIKAFSKMLNIKWDEKHMRWNPIKIKP